MTLRNDLLGRWVHDYDESTTDLTFRPVGSPRLGRSRGRTLYEFQSDGSFLEVHPGPADRSERTTGQWSVDGDTLHLSYGDDRPDERYKVTAAADKLVFSKT